MIKLRSALDSYVVFRFGDDASNCQKWGFFNPFLAHVPNLYSLKTPENHIRNQETYEVSGLFRGYKMGTLARNGFSFTRNPDAVELTLSVKSVSYQETFVGSLEFQFHINDHYCQKRGSLMSDI